MKVIAFPFAGGNMYSFNFLKDILFKKGIELKVLEYPGRGQRMRESLLYRIDHIVEDALDKLVQETREEDYFIYGHSMGGLIGYLVCKEIQMKSFKKPIKLIVSGKKAPSKAKYEKLFDLPSNIFWEKVKKLGGIQEELLEEGSIKKFFEPILRADFEAVEKYSYLSAANLTIPIDVFYGSEEINDTLDFKNWELETHNKVEIFEMEGDHFFIYRHAEKLANHFFQEIKILR
ncbi:thioesterase II family protein [Aquimarina algiphila]|uniref:thioesterase II family protein n=1 Tax=Aquimarina algiphila TaxID=2047982 RepID=UPI00232E85C8|nr:thioesterase domain-containing protein [Aquimarina algiphila]